MRKIDLVIFDCDGVLLDSELISCDCAVNALQSAGMNIDIDTVLARFVGTSRRDMGRQVQAEGYAVNPDFAEKLERSIADAFEHRLRSMPGIEQALSQLTLQRCVFRSSFAY